MTPSPLALLLDVPGRPPNLANARLHWGARARLVAERRELLHMHAACARTVARQAVATEPRKATATLHLCGRPLDPDNAHAALKADLDGIVAGGVLVDDSPEWCELEVRQVRCQHRATERVVWEVTW